MRICAYTIFLQMESVLSVLQIDLSACADKKWLFCMCICVSAQQKHNFTEQIHK
jgi:hypothetical protein